MERARVLLVLLPKTKAIKSLRGVKKNYFGCDLTKTEDSTPLGESFIK